MYFSSLSHIKLIYHKPELYSLLFSHPKLGLEPKHTASSLSCGLETARLAAACSGRFAALGPGLRNTKLLEKMLSLNPNNNPRLLLKLFIEELTQ